MLCIFRKLLALILPAELVDWGIIPNTNLDQGAALFKDLDPKLLAASFFFCTGMGAMCAERHKSPSRIQIGGT